MFKVYSPLLLTMLTINYMNYTPEEVYSSIKKSALMGNLQLSD